MTTLTNSVKAESANATAVPHEKAPSGERRAGRSDVDKFEAAFKTHPDKPGANPDKSEAKGYSSSSQSELSALFSGLMSGQGQNLGQALDNSLLPKGESTATPLNSASLQELADTLVERILVSDPKFSSGSEVRLLLGQNTGALNGSEIILRRDLEGMLAVEINCRNRDQFKKFVEVRSTLTEALESHEKGGVHLIINDPQAQSEAFDEAVASSRGGSY